MKINEKEESKKLSDSEHISKKIAKVKKKLKTAAE